MKNFSLVLIINTLRLDLTFPALNSDEIHDAFEGFDDTLARVNAMVKDDPFTEDDVKKAIDDILAEDFGAGVKENGGVWSRDETYINVCDLFVDVNPA